MVNDLISILKLIPSFAGFKGSDYLHETFEQEGIFLFDEFLADDKSRFDITAKQIQLNAFIKFLKAITHPSQHAYIDNILGDYYRNGKLLTPFGLIECSVPHGLCSGDGWTSIIGTICNYIALQYSCKIQQNRGLIMQYQIYCFGDDGLIASDCKLDLELYEKCNADLGLVVNKSKQEQSSDFFSFLGYYYFREYWNNNEDKSKVAKFPMWRILSGLYYKEKETNIEAEIKRIRHQNESEEVEFEEFMLDYQNLLIDKTGIDLLAFVMKLNNTRNLPYFKEIVKLFAIFEQHSMDPSLILPLKSLRKAFGNGRSLHSVGLENSPTMLALYEIHNTTLERVINQIEETKSMKTQSPPPKKKIEEFAIEREGLSVKFTFHNTDDLELFLKEISGCINIEENSTSVNSIPQPSSNSVNDVLIIQSEDTSSHDTTIIDLNPSDCTSIIKWDENHNGMIDTPISVQKINDISGQGESLLNDHMESQPMVDKTEVSLSEWLVNRSIELRGQIKVEGKVCEEPDNVTLTIDFRKLGHIQHLYTLLKAKGFDVELG